MQDYKVKLTPQAVEQLYQIRNYIALELLSPDTARTMLELLRESIEKLSYLPERNPKIDEQPWGNRGVRKLIVKNYYVYYIIFESEKIVKVIAVIYGKSDQAHWLGKVDV